jgi:two-component SAPR family response regulator
MEEEKLVPDVIFLDIEMPGMTGMKLAETIVNTNFRCHIIFCTSYPQYALDAIELHIGGYLGYLLKPITKEAVEKEIGEIRFPAVDNFRDEDACKVCMEEGHRILVKTVCDWEVRIDVDTRKVLTVRNINKIHFD